uniref:Uncharacterized protein n=1 Tax=Siphoviridae sp. ct96x5 TaxID=2825367 RepID=A0A8S5PQM5_9CAUD|nr:MAG TPA: hypothetical protein [Siphoviridae sp. ct96x5]
MILFIIEVIEILHNRIPLEIFGNIAIVLVLENFSQLFRVACIQGTLIAFFKRFREFIAVITVITAFKVRIDVVFCILDETLTALANIKLVEMLQHIVESADITHFIVVVAERTVVISCFCRQFVLAAQIFQILSCHSSFSFPGQFYFPDFVLFADSEYITARIIDINFEICFTVCCVACTRQNLDPVVVGLVTGDEFITLFRCIICGRFRRWEKFYISTIAAIVIPVMGKNIPGIIIHSHLHLDKVDMPPVVVTILVTNRRKIKVAFILTCESFPVLIIKLRLFFIVYHFPYSKFCLFVTPKATSFYDFGNITLFKIGMYDKEFHAIRPPKVIIFLWSPHTQAGSLVLSGRL